MKFFHVYNDQYFEGLVKNGFINEESGFKIQHVFSMPKEMKFNEYAKKGGKLYNFIKENKYPFYVDRIAGGVIYHEYDFDFELIKEYESILGEWFLGFQLHESASNRRHEWNQIIKAMDGQTGPYDLEELKKRIICDFAFTPEGVQLYNTFQATPEYFAKKKLATTIEDYHEEIKEMFKMNMDDTNGYILPCDSYYMYTHMQNELGMRTFMPEVGWQIPLMRVAVALSRGMALAYNKLWGTYYETWIGSIEEGFSMPCFNSEPGNEWYLTQDSHPDDFTSFGPNGGSSRLLQKRIYYYSLMSGANYLAEEWGLNCSYSDMNTFELSEYGLAKKEFIEDSLKLKSVKAKVPFAIVLPKKYECVEIYEYDAIGKHHDEYMEFELSSKEKAYYGHIEDVLKLVYGRNGKIYGNEGHTITNSRFGDIFDIIYEDVDDSVLAKYDYLIDATKEGSFIANKGDKFKVLDSSDLDKLEKELKTLEKEVLPVTVDKLHWLISSNEGNNYLSIFNNEGNHRSIKNGNVIDKEATETVTVSFKKPTEIDVFKASNSEIKIERKDELTYLITVPGAEFIILKF